MLTLVAVALEGCIFHIFNCIFVGDYTGNLKECALQNGVDTVAQTNLLSNLGGVYNVEFDILFSYNAFYVVGNALQGFFFVPKGIE